VGVHARADQGGRQRRRSLAGAPHLRQESRASRCRSPRWPSGCWRGASTGRAELAAKLLAKGGAAEDVDATLDDLERRGYLSDARAAQALVHQKAGRYGRRAIAHALKERRVEPEAAKAALATVAQGDEAADAQALWERRFGVAPKRRQGARAADPLPDGTGLSDGVALAVVRRAAAAGTDDDPLIGYYS
jgi:regulatory protein